MERAKERRGGERRTETATLTESESGERVEGETDKH